MNDDLRDLLTRILRTPRDLSEWICDEFELATDDALNPEDRDGAKYMVEAIWSDEWTPAPGTSAGAHESD